MNGIPTLIFKSIKELVGNCRDTAEFCCLVCHVTPGRFIILSGTDQQVYEKHVGCRYNQTYIQDERYMGLYSSMYKFIKLKYSVIQCPLTLKTLSGDEQYINTLSRFNWHLSNISGSKITGIISFCLIFTLEFIFFCC